MNSVVILELAGSVTTPLACEASVKVAVRWVTHRVRVVACTWRRQAGLRTCADYSLRLNCIHALRGGNELLLRHGVLVRVECRVACVPQAENGN